MLDHHSYFVYVDTDSEDFGKIFAKTYNIIDVNYIEALKFGIDDSRNVIKSAYTQPNIGTRKLIVVKIESITVEAQQALLKVLEEPPLSTVFLFMLQIGCSILPTLQSRFQEYKPNSTNVEVITNNDFELFCKLNYKERLEIIAKKIEKSDIKWILDIKEGLARMLISSVSILRPSTLSSLNMVVMNLNTRGASNKMLLEELSLLVPYTAEK